MTQTNNFNLQEDNDIKKVVELILRNYKLFILSIIIAMSLAIFKTISSIPIYSISASVLN